MENERLERLFKDKLGGMVLEPSKAARDIFAEKIKIQKQKTLIRRISIAASILLVALAGIYSFFPDTSDKTSLSQDGSSMMDQVGEVDQALTTSSGKEVDTEIDQIPEEKAMTASVRESTIARHDDPDRDVFADFKEATTDEGMQGNIPGEEVLAVNNIASATEKEKGHSDVVKEEQDMEAVIADHADENVYVEYFIEDPGAGSQAGEASYEPLKITIEYISSGHSNDKQQSKLKDFYARIDNIKGVDEVYGDLREYKDRLFALDFVNNKVKNEEK